MKTTWEAWMQYAEDLKAHELRMQEKEPVRDEDSPDYYIAKSKWDMEFAMTAPNKPGYYRANND